MSSVAGVGAKATTSGETIGIALEEFKAMDGSVYDVSLIGKILVFINLGWHKLDPQIAGGTVTGGKSAFWSIDESSGRIKFIGALDINDFDMINVKAIYGSAGNWSIDANGTLTVKKVQTEELCVGATCITEKELKELLELRASISPLLLSSFPPVETPGEIATTTPAETEPEVQPSSETTAGTATSTPSLSAPEQTPIQPAEQTPSPESSPAAMAL